LAILTIVAGYFGYIVYEYGLENGIMITALTWSFFVLCTPVADAGFLIDFPVRLITRMRMLFSEIMVWIFAISLNLYVLNFQSQIYQTNALLKVFHRVLTHPFPYWIVILLSALGTFISIHFGDELLDKVHHRDCHFYQHHKQKYQMIVFIFLL